MMPEIVETDLTKTEAGSPTPRSDVLIDVVHQMHHMQVHCGMLRLHSISIEPVGSPSGIATAVLKIAYAGSAAAAPFAAISYMLHAPGWLALLMTMIPFLLVVLGAGHLLLRGTNRSTARSAAPAPVPGSEKAAS